jgi:hypothetical protein
MLEVTINGQQIGPKTVFGNLRRGGDKPTFAKAPG